VGVDEGKKYGNMCVMLSATIREAQHHFSALIRRVQRGEEIEVLHRRVPVARLVPADLADSRHRPVDWAGHEVRLANLWKGKAPRGISTHRLLDELRGTR